MFTLNHTNVKLTSVNIRRELAGKNPADGRRASDLGFVLKGSNDLLDKLDVHLRGSFYSADVDKQGVLIPGALTKRIHPLLKADALLYDLQCAGYKVQIDHGIGDPIELEDCRLNNFKLQLLDGGTVAIHFRCQFHPEDGQIDPLSDKLQQEVTITCTPPKAPPPDLVDKAEGKTTGSRKRAPATAH